MIDFSQRGYKCDETRLSRQSGEHQRHFYLRQKLHFCTSDSNNNDPVILSKRHHRTTCIVSTKHPTLRSMRHTLPRNLRALSNLAFGFIDLFRSGYARRRGQLEPPVVVGLVRVEEHDEPEDQNKTVAEGNNTNSGQNVELLYCKSRLQRLA